jgi:hypothetical protein
MMREVVKKKVLKHSFMSGLSILFPLVSGLAMFKWYQRRKEWQLVENSKINWSHKTTKKDHFSLLFTDEM